VLPEEALPLVASEVKGALRELLARCRASIHLIGKHYSLVPEGGRESLLEIQNELAIEREAQGAFSRLLWIPAGVEVADERQQAVIDRLRLDPRMAKGSDLLETFFDDLRTAIQDTLARKPEPAEEPVDTGADGDLPRLYLMCDERDMDLVGPWAHGLFEEGLEVIRPVFDADEADIRAYHEESLSQCDGALVFYGRGNECWLRRKLREIQKSAGYRQQATKPAVAICLVPPRVPEKETFRTHEAVVVPQWDGFSAEPLRPFIAKLKAGVKDPRTGRH
jgi:hypothetical protein